MLENSNAIDRILLELSQIQNRHLKDRFSPAQLLPSVPKKSALLAYYVSPNNAWVWYLDANGLELHTLENSDELTANIHATRNLLDWGRYDQQQDALRQLGNVLLGRINRNLPKTLMIYATGALVGFPMDALRLQNQFLAENHDVINVLSLEAAVRPLENAKLEFPNSKISLYGPGQESETALLGAIQEIEGISEKVKGVFGSITLESGLNATSLGSVFTDGADIVHIAGHGDVDTDYPELSTLSVSREVSANRQESSVTPIELNRNENKNVGLVFLSACQSAGTSSFYFEPGLGFASSMLDSGAEFVIATLWPVPDKETTNFVLNFYSLLLVHQNYLKALAHSKRHHISENGSGSVKEWAAFQIFVN